VGTERIWYGDKEQITLGTDQDFWLALPKAELPNIKAKYVLDKKELEAPVAAHQRVGEIELYDRDKVVAHWPLVTLESVEKGGLFSRLGELPATIKSNDCLPFRAGWQGCESARIIITRRLPVSEILTYSV